MDRLLIEIAALYRDTWLLTVMMCLVLANTVNDICDLFHQRSCNKSTKQKSRKKAKLTLSVIIFSTVVMNLCVLSLS